MINLQALSESLSLLNRLRFGTGATKATWEAGAQYEVVEE